MPKKKYFKPAVSQLVQVNGAVPLAFFSAATASAAVVGVVVGAVVGGAATKAAIGRVSEFHRQLKPLEAIR
ncbi:MAG: hypothetical protein LBH00_10100 [Planctomycetaceae bacterium]|jgi:hypothetical protein|nr:hypothetical protein [Planctomycetaceae bacterium]